MSPRWKGSHVKIHIMVFSMIHKIEYVGVASVLGTASTALHRRFMFKA